MTKYVPDTRSHRWVILAPTRHNKPTATNHDYQIIKRNGLNYAQDCPFCAGNEQQTTAEIARLPMEGAWQVRSFSNMFPITDIHEVIVHHPDHLRDIENFTAEELLNLLKLYQMRLKALEENGVPILFRNKGTTSGTSLPHPHSQILVLPQEIKLESLSLEPIKNIVLDNQYFVLYCPDFSQNPYEIWIAHKKSQNLPINSPEQANIRFEQFSEEELADLGILLQKAIKALAKELGDIDYNYYFSPKGAFYLRLIPRTLVRGGFELGTGLSTNTLDPTEAAKLIKTQLD